MQRYYSYKYYLNASHSFDGLPSHAHAHTFTITLCIQVLESGFVSFMDVDKRIEQYFASFSGKYLNQVPELNDMNPTVENLGDYYFETLHERLSPYHFELMQLEIMETPLRCYCVSNSLLIPSARRKENAKIWDHVIDRKMKLFQ